MSRPVIIRFVARIVATALCAGLLAGFITACGYKGPLSQPESKPKAESGK